MFATLAVSIAVPAFAGLAYLALRNRTQGLRADVRGIALQTVIIMVVLLAIAGAVAAVLLTRGGEARDELAAQSVSIASRYTTESTCTNAGFSWNTASNPKCY